MLYHLLGAVLTLGIAEPVHQFIAKNDNQTFARCSALLFWDSARQALTEADAELVFAGEPGKFPDPSPGHADVARLRLSARGHLAVAQSNGANLEIRVQNLVNGDRREVSIPRDRWLERFERISPRGRFAVTADAHRLRARVFSLDDGQEILSTVGKPSAVEDAAEVTFSADDRFMTVNRSGKLEIFETSSDSYAQVGFAMLGERRMRLHDEPNFTWTAVARSALYLADQNALVGFYLLAEPLLIKLRAQNQARLFGFDAPGAKLQSVDSRGSSITDTYMAQAQYKPNGFISNSGRRVAAVRTAASNNEHALSGVDVIDPATRACLGTIVTPTNVLAVAFSPGDRRVAVSHSHGVDVYDLGRSWIEPELTFRAELVDASLLSFPTENMVLVGSTYRSRVYRFNLP